MIFGFFRYAIMKCLIRLEKLKTKESVSCCWMPLMRIRTHRMKKDTKIL